MADILIAEDEDILRRNLTFILSSSGYATLSARTSAEAVELLKRQRFDVVITDLIMPVQGGRELVRYVSEHCPETSVIVITAYPSADSAIDAVKKGVVDYFTKPFKTEEILRAVKKAIEARKSVPLNWARLMSLGLTKKEEELLRLMVEDGIAETRELAERLSVKASTAKQHLENIFGKFGVNNRTSLVSAVIKELRKQ
ncbi:MAG: response regulator [Nitrospirae bacterium]|nr:response regulator [Nitrospirota bacterium]